VSLQAGALVGTNVRLLKPFKRGGMGSVWLAEHLTLHTQVAVKFMSDQLAQDQEYVARFSREAMASAQIKSPHVVQVFDHGIAQDGSPFIVMELLEGEDLRVRLSRVGTIGVEEAAAVVVQLARALSKAHAAGIVHRDIKPDNVFLTDQDGELFVKVLDFGIAKHAAGDGDELGGMTGTGAMVGTPHYMSPEQIVSARRVDHRADLWSVGVVLYRALTGQVPFQGETLGAVCIAIEKGNFVAPSQRRPGLTPTLDAWFQRALARDVAHRFQSAKEMADAFVVALGAGGYPAMAAPFRIDASAAGTNPQSMTPAPGSSRGWGATPPPVSAAGLGPVAPSGLETPVPSRSGAHAGYSDASWASSGGASQSQPQTFHGASVTQAEWKSSSRRAMVTVISAVLGVVVLVAIVVAIIVKNGGEGHSPATAASTAVEVPAAPVVTAAPVPVVSAAPVPESSATDTVPAPAVATAPSVAQSPSSTSKPQGCVKATSTSTSTGRPKRDRGF
jgi:eukaryotic-like serine/threonine-protein kinase